jgi:hypothetical protein
MGHPHAWSRYVAAPSVAGKPNGDFARFGARYSLASSLVGVSLDGISEATAEAYSSALGVALAYSALEALDKATHNRGTQHVVGDADLARRYRATSLSKLRSLLESTASAPALQSRLASLAGGSEGDDVMPVARALRHTVFHGDFTAYGAGAATSKTVRRFLDDLKEALLLTADAEFELYLDRRAIGPWDVDVLSMCPACRAPVGKTHASGCSIGRCKAHGEPRDQCFGAGRHSTSTYWGVYPGTIEALKRGWTTKLRGSVRPDLNRVLSELTWDPDTEQFA